MSRFLEFFKDKKLQTILAPVFKLCEAILELCVPVIVAKVIDIGIANGDVYYIWTRCVLLVALGIIGLIFAVIAQYFSASVATGFASSVRRAVYDKLNTMSFADLDKTGAESVIIRMTGDVDRLQTGVNMGLRLFLRSPFIVFGAVIGAFCVDAIGATVFAVIVPILGVVVSIILLFGIKYYHKAQNKLEKITLLTRENIGGVRVLRAFAKEDEENKKFREENEKFTRAQCYAGRISALLNPLTFALINLAVVALVYVGGIRVNSGAIAVGKVVALYNYLSQILIELIKFANLIITVARAAASGKRVNEMLSIPETQTFAKEEVEEKENCPAIEFRHINFSYGNEHDVLSDIDFSVKKGEIFGIIGGTGSGKSTVLNLIPRFYDVSEGTISVDGINVNEYPKKQLRDKIGVVMQNPFLLSDTIEYNICFGKADEEKLDESIKISQSEDIVASKTNGIKEQVLAGGVNFSGGQKQRLSVARALYKDADILLLDNAESALDNITAKRLRKGLAETGKTVVVASQRASGVKFADRILVLDKGKMVGLGTHNELMESCAQYRENYLLQNQAEGNV